MRHDQWGQGNRGGECVWLVGGASSLRSRPVDAATQHSHAEAPTSPVAMPQSPGPAAPQNGQGLAVTHLPPFCPQCHAHHGKVDGLHHGPQRRAKPGMLRWPEKAMGTGCQQGRRLQLELAMYTERSARLGWEGCRLVEPLELGSWSECWVELEVEPGEVPPK